MKTIYGIQYLRAFAALAVVFFHAAEKTGYHFAIGAAGVDVFFIISGFIMWVISDRRALSPGRFLAERALRIIPVYWLATAVMIVGAAFGLFPNLVLTTQHILSSLFFVPARSPSSGELWPVLVQGWTLNYEMFFYLVFASSLFLRANMRLIAVALVFMMLVLLGALVGSDIPPFVTYTRPIMLEFVVGMVIGKLWLKGLMPRHDVGLALILLALAGFFVLQVFRLPFSEFNCGPLAAALVVGTLSLEAAGRVHPWKLPAFLGNASYSIYLWHTFAISVIAKAAITLGLASGITFPVAVVGGIVSGSVAYLLIEQPLVKRLRFPAISPRSSAAPPSEA
ncbi:acyltransferase (plasmid) [Rhizobium sp. 32-5/1]|uniref:acyltransferase family protein n=1 Tax=Rhizobium sp. 32-5/1 TaxID=3019602 RepID=UPI00240DCB05|nr:acyltransferase [Rhizobium sp. 32-5/1]WEZ85297.1 acyltransferase [Rhizobium sp. 32-5/1]